MKLPSLVVTVFVFFSRAIVPFCIVHLMGIHAWIGILLLQMEQYAGQGMYVTLFAYIIKKIIYCIFVPNTVLE